MSPSKRSETTYGTGRCLKCAVGLNHTARTCKKSVRCTVDGFAKPWQHITLLHGSTFKITKKPADSSNVGAATTASSVTPSATASAFSVVPSESKSARKALFKIVPVRLMAGERVCDTFVFLDNGSDTTFIRHDIASTKLGLGDLNSKLKVKTYDGSEKEVDTAAVDFIVASHDEKIKFTVKRAYSVNEINIRPNPTTAELNLASWPHLAGLKFPEVDQDYVIILIGIDVVGAHCDARSKAPPPHLDGPAAFKTPFGWCLGGKMVPPTGGREHSIREFPWRKNGPALTQQRSDSGPKSKITAFARYCRKTTNVVKRFSSRPSSAGIIATRRRS